MRRGNNAQSFIEYAVLIGVLAGVIIAMKIYITRIMQERVRQAADVFGQGRQYEKGVTEATDE
jgi:biopolymer transport protein ExbB/TolQ